MIKNIFTTGLKKIPKFIVFSFSKKTRFQNVYMDMQATTPLDFRVHDKMMPYLQDEFGNPHSRNHQYGWTADKAVEKSRSQIASLINCDAKDIIFTSGATESNNLALQGIARFYKSRKNHIITLQTEHKCILDTCRNLQDEGFKVSYVPVDKEGLVDLNEISRRITKETLLVSTMFVNNEIGVIQPIKEIGQICKDKGVFMHCDAAQALGKLPIDVKEMNIDLLSMSSHKIYGPKGIGALYINKGPPRVRLKPLLYGGGQERGLRSGTLAPALCVGFGEACRIASHEMESDYLHMKSLYKRFLTNVMKNIPYTQLNGSRANPFYGNINISFEFVEGESLMMRLNTVSMSSGSACTTTTLEPSYVLRALGKVDELAHTSIRFGIGRFTTKEEVDYAAKRLRKAVGKLRKMSPLWEMAQKNIDIGEIKWEQPN